MSAWLHIIGIGEEGEAGLLPASREILAQADVILGGDRHHKLAVNSTAERLSWPSPFNAMIETIKSLKGRRVVVLVTGDPLWYSVGARITRAIPAEEIVFHPQLSAFQWMAARMGWSLADLETLTVHGRPVEQMIPFIRPDARMLLLTAGSETPAQVAEILTARGYGPSQITVCGSLGGPDEVRIEGVAEGFNKDVPAFNTMAVECKAGPNALVIGATGLPDEAFQSDGTMTKRDIRAITLAKLMPMRGALLWDIGAGCGSVSIEWMRAGRDARAIAIEPREDRRAMAAVNALKLGAPALDIREGNVPGALHDLPMPDAVFIGGGLSAETLHSALFSLKQNGRLVANAVTLESEALLAEMHQTYGGDLVRIAVQKAEPVGKRRGWRAAMPVTQWSLIKT